MDLSQLEAEALKLEPGNRARLAQKLLVSLERLSDEENEQIWLDEATRRDTELDADPSRGRPAAQVPGRPEPVCCDLPVVFHDLAERELNDTATYSFATDQPASAKPSWPKSNASSTS